MTIFKYLTNNNEVLLNVASLLTMILGYKFTSIIITLIIYAMVLYLRKKLYLQKKVIVNLIKYTRSNSYFDVIIIKVSQANVNYPILKSGVCSL